MNKISRTIFTVILLASSAAGLRAQQFPNTAVLRMPQISTVAAAQIATCDLTAIIADENGNPIPKERARAMHWKDGVWKTDQRDVMVQLLFPIKHLIDQGKTKLSYKTEYKIVLSNKAKQELKLTSSLPMSATEPFTADAVLPLDTVTIDAGGLKYDDSALRGVRVTLDGRLEGRERKQSVAFAPRTAQTAVFLIDRGSKASSQILFVCNYKGKMVQLPWDDNNKELSTPPSGLNIRLAQPDCPQ